MQPKYSHGQWVKFKYRPSTPLGVEEVEHVGKIWAVTTYNHEGYVPRYKMNGTSIWVGSVAETDIICVMKEEVTNEA